MGSREDGRVGGYRIVLEFYLETPAALDAKYEELTGLGYVEHCAPYDVTPRFASRWSTTRTATRFFSRPLSTPTPEQRPAPRQRACRTYPDGGLSRRPPCPGRQRCR